METSAVGAATSAIARRSFDATISAPLDAETSALNVETSALARRRSRGVTGDIGAEFPAILARSFRRYRQLRSWYNSEDV